MIIKLYTDGACQPNPGAGGWAFIACPEEHPKNRIVKSGFEKETTNNRMEITAVLKGLDYVNQLNINIGSQEYFVTLFSDSKYILNGIETWMHNWVNNGWIKKDKKPVLNDDLWKQIYTLAKTISITCKHVKGHSGHPENEECDKLAVAEIAKNKNE